jgi:hypothetical protein
MFMVLVTTFIAPPLLRRLLTKAPDDAAAGESDAGALVEMTTEA